MQQPQPSGHPRAQGSNTVQTGPGKTGETSKPEEESRRLLLAGLATLGLILAMLIAAAGVAGPALGQQVPQQQKQGGQEGPYQAEETTITGVVSTGQPANLTRPLYVVADEETGVDRIIESPGPDEGGPVLSRYVGQRVTLTGIPQTLGNPPSNFDNFLSDVPVLVNSIETIGGQNTGDQYDGGGTGNGDTGSGDRQTPSGETVEVTFEVTVDGEVGEGKLLNVNRPQMPDPGRTFCATFSIPDVPDCEDGETYATTFTVEAGEPLPYEYQEFSYLNRRHPDRESFKAGTITPTGNTTVSATYRAEETRQPPQDQYDEETGNGETGNGGVQYDQTDDPVEGGVNSGGGDSGDAVTKGGGDQQEQQEQESRDGLTVLPDTGGLSLWSAGIAGFGAALVAGGVLLRRLSGWR